MPVDLQVEKRHEGEVAQVTLDRPAKLNALDSDTVRSLRDAVRELHDAPELRVLILTGAGERAFSAGADVEELAQHTPASARRFITLLHEAHGALRTLPVPVIGRVNGYCLGAGLEMAVSCDFRIAAVHAVFGMPEVQVGLPSVIEAALLPRLIGWGKTNELLMTGEPIDASEAHRCGLVEAVAPLADLDTAIEQRVSAIVKAGPLAVKAQKKLMGEWECLALERALERGIDYLEKAYETDEPRRMLARMRRQPR